VLAIFRAKALAQRGRFAALLVLAKSGGALESPLDITLRMQAEIGHLEVEEARALFMDGQGRYLAEVSLVQGGRDQLILPARKIAGIIQLLDADMMLLAHNHPSGSCEPSAEDVRTTRGIAEMLCSLGVTLYDHIIVTRASTFSFRAAGCL